jgi:hypothetical protein
MPGPLLHAGAIATCPHAGTVQTVPTNVRVTVSTMPVITMADQSLVAGCALTAAVPPTPCLKIQWIPSARVKVMGVPAAVAVPPGISVGPVPGPAVILSVQPRVIAQ